MLIGNSRRFRATTISEGQSGGHLWKKPAAVAVSLAMTIGGLMIGQSFVAPQAQAAATTHKIGTFPLHDWLGSSHSISQPLKVDDQTLYTGGASFSWGYLKTNGEPVNDLTQTLFGTPSVTPTSSTNPNPSGAGWIATIAVDANIDGARPAAYGYSWDWDATSSVTGALSTLGVAIPAGSGITNSNTIPLYRIKDGETQAQWIPIPISSYFGQTGSDIYWSGGEVIQSTGQIFFSGGECSTMNNSFSMMIYDPYSGDYNFSGLIKPATTADNIFGTSASTCGGAGYVSSDMALDANGNAFVLVISNQAAPAFGLAAATRTWLVRIVPSSDPNVDWTYELVAPITAGPGQTSVPIGSDQGTMWGMAFYQGSLYVIRPNHNIAAINVMSGQAFNVPVGASEGYLPNDNRDLASGQTAIVVQGTVYNDVGADGSVTGDPGLPSQQVALYMKVGDNYVYEGMRTTNTSGNYSFLLGGYGDYIVRLVQPTIDGVDAVQTFADGGGTLNPVTAQCVNGNVARTDGDVCTNAVAMPTSDPALPTAATAPGSDTSTQPNQMAIYSNISISSDHEVANADFGVTATGSYGDAAAGPASVTAGAPVHINGAAPQLWLGASLGSYAGPATDNSAHDATDDGVYIDSYSGKISLDGTVLAGTKSYQMAADVSGPAASSAHVYAWTTGAGNNTWSSSPTWSPAVSGGKATGAYQFQSSGTLGAATQAVQMRVNASTVDQSAPTNASGAYQSSTSWATPGEIEDYEFSVADAVYRPAATTTGGTGTFTVAGVTVTAGTDVSVGSAVGTPAGTVVNLTASTPQSWTVKGITIKDTESGAVIAEPDFTLSATQASFSYTPDSGSDVIIEVMYAHDPDPTQSTLTLDKDSTQVGTYIQATATVSDTEGNLLDGVVVSFAKKSADVTLSDPTCTTVAGTCSVTVTSNVAKTYTDEISATVKVAAQDTGLLGSPKTVTFTAGPFSYDRSSFAVTPVANTSDKTTWQTANGASAYTGVLTAEDGDGNPLTSLASSDIAFAASSTDVNITSVVNNNDGTYSVSFTSHVASGEYTASVKYQNTAVGTDKPIPFKAGEPDINPNCPDPARPGTNLTVSPASLPAGGTSNATALVTDADCNPIQDSSVTFTLDTGSSALLTVIQAMTDVDGKAYASVTDTAAESVIVHARITQGELHGSPATVTFTEGGFSWLDSSFAVTPVANTSDQTTWAIANGTSAYTGVLTAKDNNGNLLSNLVLSDIAFSASSTDVAVSSVTNNNNGTYSVSFTSHVASPAYTAAVNYQDSPVGTAKPIPFTAGPPDINPYCPDPARPGTNLSVSPASVQVGGSSTATALVTDRDCNPIEGSVVTFSTEKSASIAPLTLATGTDGKAIAHVTDTVAESVDVHARITEGELPGSPAMVTFTEGGFSWMESSFAVTPVANLSDSTTWQIANGASAYVGTLTAKDNNQNLLPNLSTSDMVFSASSADVTVSSVTNNNNGTYTVSFTSHVADPTYTATATYQSDPVGTAQPIPFVAGPPSINPNCPDPARPGTNLTVSPATVQIGGSSTATALVTDRDCNPIKGSTVTFSTEKSASIDPLSLATGTDGKAIAYVTDETPEEVAVHARITEGELPGSPATVTFIDSGFSWLNSSFTVTPVADTSDKATWVVADGSSAYTGVLTAKDGSNVAVSNLATSDIVFAASSADVVVSSVTNNNDGTYSVLFTSRVASPDPTASVTYIGARVGVDKPIPFVAGPASINPNCPDPARPGTNLSASPTAVQVGGTSTATALVTDANCNPVEGSLVTFATEKSASIAPLTRATGSDGKAIATLTDTVAESVDVHATITQGELPGSPATVRFIEGGFSYTKSSFSVSPVANISDRTTWVTADGASAYRGVLTAEDDDSNPLPDLVVADMVFTASSTDVAVSNVTNNHDGTYSVSYTSRVASPSPTASVTYLGDPVGTSKPIPFAAGTPSVNPVCTDPARPGTNLTVSPASLPVGNQATATALVTDANCNPVSDSLVTFSLGTPTSALLTVVQALTGSDGKAYARVTDTAAEAVDVHAVITQGELPGSPATVTFTSGGFSWLDSSFAVTPVANTLDSTTWVTADGESAYRGVLTAKDSNGNLLSNLAVSDMVFAASSPDVAVSNVVNYNNGTYSVSFTSRVSTTIGSPVPVASVTYQDGQVGTNKPIPFAAGTPSINPVCTDPARPGTNLSVSPTSLPAGSQATATALVTDSLCNPVPNTVVTFSTTKSSSVAPLTVTTGSDGKAVAKVSDNVAETVSVSARITQGELPGSPASVTFTAGAPSINPVCTDPARPGTNLSVSPTSLPAGSQATATALVTDSLCNPVPNATVTFSTTKSASIAPLTVTTGSDGKAIAKVSDNVAETVEVRATITQGELPGSPASVTFTAGTPSINPVCIDPARPGTNLSVSPNSLPAGSQATATALVTDSLCNPVPNTVVTFSTTKSSTIAPLTVTTGSDGKAVAKVSDNVAETVSVSATITQGELPGSPASVTFTAGAPSINPVCTDPARPGTNLSVSPNSLPAGSEATATALVTDSLCNPVPNATVTFSTNKSASIAPLTVTTGSDGKAIAKVSDNVAETVSVRATITQGELPGSPASVTFTAGAPSINPVCTDPARPGTNLTVDPATVVIPNTSTATAYITDAYCNPVGAGVHVTFAVDGKAAVSTKDAVTNADGKAIVTVSDATVETVNVHAVIAGIDNGEIHGSPAQVTFVSGAVQVKTGGAAAPASPLRGLFAGVLLAAAGVWIGVKFRRA